MNKTEIIERARKLADLKVPFQHQGRSLKGIDCVGLLAYAVQYESNDIPNYGRDPAHGILETELEKYFGAPVLTGNIVEEDLEPGDVAAMHYDGPIRHVGIIATHRFHEGKLALIHTDSNLERVTEHILDAKWLRRIKKVYR